MDSAGPWRPSFPPDGQHRRLQQEGVCARLHQLRGPRWCEEALRGCDPLPVFLPLATQCPTCTHLSSPGSEPLFFKRVVLYPLPPRGKVKRRDNLTSSHLPFCPPRCKLGIRWPPDSDFSHASSSSLDEPSSLEVIWTEHLLRSWPGSTAGPGSPREGRGLGNPYVPERVGLCVSPGGQDPAGKVPVTNLCSRPLSPSE